MKREERTYPIIPFSRKKWEGRVEERREHDERGRGRKKEIKRSFYVLLKQPVAANVHYWRRKSWEFMIQMMVHCFGSQKRGTLMFREVNIRGYLSWSSCTLHLLLFSFSSFPLIPVHHHDSLLMTTMMMLMISLWVFLWIFYGWQKTRSGYLMRPLMIMRWLEEESKREERWTWGVITSWMSKREGESQRLTRGSCNFSEVDVVIIILRLLLMVRIQEPNRNLKKKRKQRLWKKKRRCRWAERRELTLSEIHVDLYFGWKELRELLLECKTWRSSSSSSLWSKWIITNKTHDFSFFCVDFSVWKSFFSPEIHASRKKKYSMIIGRGICGSFWHLNVE